MHRIMNRPLFYNLTRHAVPDRLIGLSIVESSKVMILSYSALWVAACSKLITNSFINELNQIGVISKISQMNRIQLQILAIILISTKRYNLNKLKKKRQLTSFQDHVEVMDFSGWNYFFCYKLNKRRHVKTHLPFFYHYTSLKYKRKKIVMYCNGFVLFLISFMSSEFWKKNRKLLSHKWFWDNDETWKSIRIAFLKAMRIVEKNIAKFTKISKANNCI